MGIAANFKKFLEEHQRVVKKQEEKKSRIIGSGGSGSAAKSAGATARGGSQVGVGATSLQNKRKIRILPQHKSQQANRLAGQRGISAADYTGLSGNDDDGMGAPRDGYLEMED